MKVDPFTMFADKRGVYLTSRQLVFCKTMLAKNNSTAAAKAAGYPESEANDLYSEHKEVLEAWREQERSDYFLALSVHRRAASAIVEFKDKEGKVTETLDAYKTQDMGAKGLRAMLGFDEIVQTTNDQNVTFRWLAEGEKV